MEEITCIYCGKSCTSKQSRAAHYRYCSIKLRALGIENECLAREQALRVRMREQAKAKAHVATEKRFAEKKAEWEAVEHICERCGQPFTTKIGTGRFCSMSCANTREHSVESRFKCSQALAATKAVDIKEFLFKKEQEANRPKRVYKDYSTLFCKLCGKPIPFGRQSLYCSSDCGGFDHRGGLRTTSTYGKQGTYADIHCDSTYELAFLVYCLDHNINIERNHKYFVYEFEGKQHRYYPDFYLPDTDSYVEIKGYAHGPVELKAASVPPNQYIYLDHEKLAPVFEYICKKYPEIEVTTGKNNLDLLYNINSDSSEFES